jgi:hypothetical protein
MTKEEILKNKIDSHKWGYSYSNIESTDGTMNDFLNIALEAMDEYANQDNEYITRLENGLNKIIQMNRQQGEDQYGNPDKAEKWGCVVVAREALNSKNS